MVDCQVWWILQKWHFQLLTKKIKKITWDIKVECMYLFKWRHIFYLGNKITFEYTAHHPHPLFINGDANSLYLGWGALRYMGCPNKRHFKVKTKIITTTSTNLMFFFQLHLFPLPIDSWILSTQQFNKNICTMRWKN